MISSQVLRVLVLLVLVSQVGWGKTLGLWKDGRSEITDGMMKTFQEAGWTIVMLQGADLGDDAKLAGMDVVFLPGGWNAVNFADLKARRALVKYVAGGKGVLAGAFRSGYVRTGNRPIFPQVGATFNRVNGSLISSFGDSELAKAITQPFNPGNWDHLVVKVGPLGKVFAVNGDDPVGVYGEVYGGRYLVFGAFIGMDAKTEAMQGVPRQVLLKSLEWLAAAPTLSDADKTKYQTQADMELLRRETLWNWTLNERGPDNQAGLIPSLFGSLAKSLESRQYRLDYMSRFLVGDSRDKAGAESEALKKELATLNANVQKAVAETTARIERMSAKELLDDKPADFEKAMREKLFPASHLAEVKQRADTVIAQLRPLVRAVKAEQMAKEHQADLNNIPELMKQCSSAEGAVRLEAVRELGRIGDPKSAEVLIGALADKDEKICVEAIQALGWMQAKDAVPALMALVESGTLRIQSRAIQALGQIGDDRATPVIISHLNDKHPFLAENAIMSAGWLKAKAAVPELLKIVSSGNAQVGEQRVLMTAAIRALGHIGDLAALPKLEAIVAAVNDVARVRTGSGLGGEILNFYSTPQGLGLKRYSEFAIAEIKEGGRSEVGVKQPDFLASKDGFYALTKKFNALAGRAIVGDKTPAFEEDAKALLAYIAEAGFTGLHNAWGNQDGDPAQYAHVIEAAGDLGLIWLDVLPINVFPYRSTFYSDNPQNSLEKAAGDLVLSRYRNMPAFAGFWSEESYPGIKATAADFERWLIKKYGPDYRKQLGLGREAVIPGNGQQFIEVSEAITNSFKSLFLEFGADRILEYWGETQDWLRGVRKGCAFTYSISEQQFATYIGLTGPVGDTISVNGPESYQSFGRDNAFLMEMYKDGGARPVMSEFYNWYTPSPAHEIRGFAQHLMHGECFYNFAFEQIFKYPGQNSYRWIWDASRWDNARAMFQKAARIKEYLAVPASAANVAQLCSESTACHFNERSSLAGRWYQQQVALWTALQQSQIPADVIWAETLTPEKLARYCVLVMVDAKMLTEMQAGLIRDWVNQGGVLIASGTSTLFDRIPFVRKNYLLADVFGVEYAGFAGVTDSAHNDTLYFQHGKQPSLVEPTMEVSAFRHHILRDVKPVKSIGSYKIDDKAGDYLPQIVAGTLCEYDMPLGYDKVKLASAEVLAKFTNGDPALTMNKVGKGLCYFWTPIYPGLCHVVGEWEMMANRKDFWPNDRELLAAMVKGGLLHQQANLPVDVTGVSTAVEVTVRQQPAQNRWMVHLLDYNPKSDSVKGALLTVHLPSGKTVKRIFYPDTDTQLKFTSGESGTTASLRDFGVHDMVVVEWK